MNIGIDTNILLIDNAGPAVYTRELIRHLEKIDNLNSYFYFFYGNRVHKNKLFNQKAENFIRDTLWMQFTLLHKLKKNKIDILHCPAFKAPLKCDIPLIVTFYDIYILKEPYDYRLWLRLYCSNLLSKIAKIAKKIITISEFSKKDIINSLSIREDKVVVTHCGVSDKFHLIEDNGLRNDIREKYNLKKKFILYVGAIQPRKNIPALLKAFSLLVNKRRLDYQLVLVGGTGWKNKDIFTLVNSLNIAASVKFLGHVPDDDLPVIYNLAEFFVYPSFFEGFGMPVIEAMACGCPVVTANTSSFPEIVKDAGIMVNPKNTEELEEAMDILVKDITLSRNLREKGLNRAKMFSWEKCAKETLSVYEEVFSSK